MKKKISFYRFGPGDASAVIAAAQQMRSDPSAMKKLLKAKLVEIVKASGRDASLAEKFIAIYSNFNAIYSNVLAIFSFFFFANI